MKLAVLNGLAILTHHLWPKSENGEVGRQNYHCNLMENVKSFIAIERQ